MKTFILLVDSTRLVEMILKKACSQVCPESATCVQKFDDSLNSAIRTTYRISLRSSSLREPRYPLLRVVISLIYVFFLCSRPFFTGARHKKSFFNELVVIMFVCLFVLFCFFLLLCGVVAVLCVWFVTARRAEQSKAKQKEKQKRKGGC